MKKEFIVTFIAILSCLNLYAQEAGIIFKELNWKEAISIAKKENKIIFIDCYTSWCGPCKMLANTTFKENSVGEFFNKNFICLKMDMEKGEGINIGKKYNVKAFPTLLFIDFNENLKHRIVGYQTSEKLIEEGSIALNDKENLNTYIKEYENGNRSTDFMNKFILKLQKAGIPKMQAKVASEIINSFNEQEYLSRKCWDLYSYNITNPLSPEFQKFYNKRRWFEQIIDKDTVNAYINYVMSSKANSYLWIRSRNGKFNEDEYNNYIDFIKKSNYIKAPEYLATMYTAKTIIANNFEGMINEMKKAFHYCIFQEDSKLSYINVCFNQLIETHQTQLIEKCIPWIDEIINEQNIGYFKSEYMLVKARLLEGIGKKKEAQILKDEAPKVRMQR